MAWSPLGRGVLTGKYRRGTPADSRAASAHLAGFVQPYLSSGARTIGEALVTPAHVLGKHPAEVALPWVRDQRPVACATLGARTAQQLRVSSCGQRAAVPD